jgi:hypothetical protein
VEAGRTAPLKKGKAMRLGVLMRLNAMPAGLRFSQGRYELYIQLSQ